MMILFFLYFLLCLLHFLVQGCRWMSHDCQADIIGWEVLPLPSQADPSSSCLDPHLMCYPSSCSLFICHKFSPLYCSCIWVEVRLSTRTKTCSLHFYRVVAEFTQRQTATTGHYNPFQLLLLTGNAAHRIDLSGCIVFAETHSNLLPFVQILL